jgi:hypothetical protein
MIPLAQEKTMSDTRRSTLSLAAAVLVALSAAACGDAPTAIPSPGNAPALALHGAAPSAQPVRLQFEKCIVDPVNGIWEGEVKGDIDGDLRTELLELQVTGKVWHVRFHWIITAGEQSLVADLSGILNLGTGRVVMNGRVVQDEGFGFIEAQVHEEGQLVDAANSCFVGDILIMPATAGHAAVVGGSQ